LAQGAFGYGMTLLNTGDVLVCGGVNASDVNVHLSTCTLYNGALTPFVSLPMAIAYFAMVQVKGDDDDPIDNTYVFGGYNGSNVVDTVYAFDMWNARNVWSVRAPMPVALANHSVVAVKKHNQPRLVVVCGGRDDTGTVQSACYV
jgi:N-acetylneuraminic acid mutarotase